MTLSDAVDMPVNLGMQFVPRGRYLNAIGFLNDVIAIYPFNETFIAGQASRPADFIPGYIFLSRHLTKLSYILKQCWNDV